VKNKIHAPVNQQIVNNNGHRSDSVNNLGKIDSMRLSFEVTFEIFEERFMKRW